MLSKATVFAFAVVINLSFTLIAASVQIGVTFFLILEVSTRSDPIWRDFSIESISAVHAATIESAEVKSSVDGGLFLPSTFTSSRVGFVSPKSYIARAFINCVNAQYSMALSKSSRSLLRAFSIASYARALSLAIFDAENVCARKGTSASAGSEVAVALKILGTEFTSCNECEREDFSIFSNSASNSGVNAVVTPAIAGNKASTTNTPSLLFSSACTVLISFKTVSDTLMTLSASCEVTTKSQNLVK